MRKFFIFLLPVLVFICCERKSIEKDNNVVCQKETITLTAIISEKQESGTSENVFNAFWSADDTIGVYGSLINNSPFAIHSGKGTAKGEFKGSYKGTPLYAYYPYKKEAESDFSRISFNLPSEQFESELTTEMFPYLIKAGKYVKSESNENFFDLKPVISYLKFIIKSSGSDISEDKIESISLKTSDNTTLTGNFTLNLSDASLNFNKDACSCAKLIYKTPRPLSSTVEGLMAINADINENDSLLIVLTTDKHTASLALKAGINYKNGHLYTVSLNIGNQSQSTVITENETFTNITEYGIYDLSGTSPTVIAIYRPFKDQWTSKTTQSEYVFKIQNNQENKCYTMSLPKISYKIGNNYSLIIKSIAEPKVISGTYTVKVLKEADNRLWLKDETNNKGYVIFK